MKEMRQVSISGLSCASCAADLETTLRSRDGLAGCSVNFALAQISFPADKKNEVVEILAEVEPNARLVENQAAHEDQDKSAKMKMSLRLLLAASLFIVLILFENYLREEGMPALVWLMAILAWLVAGWAVIGTALRNIVRGKVFDENFLMTLATLGAFAIGYLPEAAGVMLFYHLGELIQEKAVRSSRDAISVMASVQPETSRVLVNGVFEIMPTKDVRIGALIEVWPGERISHDGELESEFAWLDTSALTGESRPKRFKSGMEVGAGCLVIESPLRLRVTRPADQSAVARIMHLVENATERKAKVERFMTRFASVYTPVVVFAALAIAVFPPLLISEAEVRDWLFRALVFLVVSCPCALVISIPLGYFAGIGAASRVGLLVKGGEVLDRLARTGSVAFDKTGTLTDGKFLVRQIKTAQGMDELGLLGLAAAMEEYSNHPIARAIRAAWSSRSSEPAPEVRDLREIRGRGMQGRLADGQEVACGSAKFLQEHGCAIPLEEKSIRGTVHLSLGGRWIGRIEIDDAVRPSAGMAIDALRRLGVSRLAVISGDEEERVSQTAQSLGLPEFYGGLLPEGKLRVLEAIMADSAARTTIFVGDGINDAPVLRRADVGIAMGGLGSDAAIEAGDAVLVWDDPLIVARGVRIAKATRRIVWQNITFALLVKLVFLVMGGLGLASLWEAVIADVGVALIALANAMRLVWYTARVR